MTQEEVLEFIIVPPFEQRENVARAKERFEDYLSRRFPGYSFKVAHFAPVGEPEDFCVLPVMNFLGPDGGSYMCKEPRRWFMQEIAKACLEFDLVGKRSFAARSLQQPELGCRNILLASRLKKNG